jgi:hypothetical protein
VLDFRNTIHKRVRSLEDRHDGCPFERIVRERHTRRHRLAAVHHRFNEHHHSVVAAPPEATHIPEHQDYFSTAPPHEFTNGVQGRFGQRPQECHALSIRLASPVERASSPLDTYADLLLSSHLSHDVEVHESGAGHMSRRGIRGCTRRPGLENTIQLLSGKAALGHGDLIQPHPEAKILLEEAHHHL